MKSSDCAPVDMTTDAYLRLLSCGHPGGASSVAQAGIQLIAFGADMARLRDACTDADDAALLSNGNVRVVSPH